MQNNIVKKTFEIKLALVRDNYAKKSSNSIDNDISLLHNFLEEASNPFVKIQVLETLSLLYFQKDRLQKQKNICYAIELNFKALEIFNQGDFRESYDDKLIKGTIISLILNFFIYGLRSQYLEPDLINELITFSEQEITFSPFVFPYYTNIKLLVYQYKFYHLNQREEVINDFEKNFLKIFNSHFLKVNSSIKNVFLRAKRASYKHLNNVIMHFVGNDKQKNSFYKYHLINSLEKTSALYMHSSYLDVYEQLAKFYYSFAANAKGQQSRDRYFKSLEYIKKYYKHRDILNYFDFLCLNKPNYKLYECAMMCYYKINNFSAMKELFDKVYYTFFLEKNKSIDHDQILLLRDVFQYSHKLLIISFLKKPSTENLLMAIHILELFKYSHITLAYRYKYLLFSREYLPKYADYVKGRLERENKVYDNIREGIFNIDYFKEFIKTTPVDMNKLLSFEQIKKIFTEVETNILIPIFSNYDFKSLLISKDYDHVITSQTCTDISNKIGYNCLSDWYYHLLKNDSDFKDIQIALNAVLNQVSDVLSDQVLEQSLKKDSDLIICQDARLFSFPFGLINSKSYPNSTLIETYNISYINSLTELGMHQLRLKEKRMVKTDIAIIVNNELKFSSLETKLINKIFSNEAFIIESSSPEFKENISFLSDPINYGYYNYWHIICHGNFNSNFIENFFLNFGSGKELTTHDISLLAETAFNPRLVTLSSCDTAKNNSLMDWQENVVNFQTLFSSVGAIGVIGSIWQVSEIASCLTMVRFYDLHIKHQMKPQHALKLTQIWLKDTCAKDLISYLNSFKDEQITEIDLKDMIAFLSQFESDQQPFQDPVIWGGLTLYGL